ncbi:unnamed protein product [Moneuplotes crassus]|uniref:Uncharacterized protein n=1 Tax=Euplotes crassus TaxID=5936 RepID=A0AAD1UMD7_EUPCR|nr:unnamed protein product [Moneuplotes crassus]
MLKFDFALHKKGNLHSEKKIRLFQPSTNWRSNRHRRCLISNLQEDKRKRRNLSNGISKSMTDSIKSVRFQDQNSQSDLNEIVDGTLKKLSEDYDSSPKKPLDRKMDFFYSSFDGRSHRSSNSSNSTLHITSLDGDEGDCFGSANEGRNWSLIAKKILGSENQEYNQFLKSVNKKMFRELLHKEQTHGHIKGVKNLQELMNPKNPVSQLLTKLILKNKKLTQLRRRDREESTVHMPDIRRSSPACPNKESMDEYGCSISHIKDFLQLKKAKKRGISKRRSRKYVVRGRSQNKIVYEIKGGSVHRKVLQK